MDGRVSSVSDGASARPIVRHVVDPERASGEDMHRSMGRGGGNNAGAH